MRLVTCDTSSIEKSTQLKPFLLWAISRLRSEGVCEFCVAYFAFFRVSQLTIFVKTSRSNAVLDLCYVLNASPRVLFRVWSGDFIVRFAIFYVAEEKGRMTTHREVRTHKEGCRRCRRFIYSLLVDIGFQCIVYQTQKHLSFILIIIVNNLVSY